MTEPLWQPPDAAWQSTLLGAFWRRAESHTGQRFPDYAALHRWSIEAPAAFWNLVADFTGIHFQRLPASIVEHPERFPGARWFQGARLNFAENLLRFRDERPALISVLETGARCELSYSELYARTARLAAALRTLGVKPGDRVAGWLPNQAEACIAMLATASLGAVWSSCSPEFGAGGALDRFGQIEPRVLFATDGYHYGGKAQRTRARMAAVAEQLPSLLATIWVDCLGELDTEDLRFDELSTAGNPPDLSFEPRAFDDPLYVLYSSGTTGRPKCIVHGVGGTLIQHLKEHQLHLDLRREDRLFYFTTCGWMMWNWLMSGLASGATLILYDGSPFHPGPEQLWELTDRERITVFGTSAKYLSALEKSGYSPARQRNLGSLRQILSTGSPLSEEGFYFCRDHIGRSVPVASISGGTDIVSCFVLGNPLLPVHAGEIQCRGLGMAVEVWSDEGHPLQETRGELVCVKPFPSAPVGFWNDPEDQAYRQAYFSRFPGIWCQGDYARITRHDGIVIYGRSDATLNPGGVRIGTAEIYRQVESFDEVLEAVCIGQRWQDDVRVLLFLVLRPGAVLDDRLAQAIRERIRQEASPRHVPARILSVPDIPRTLSGKIAELAVRQTIEGEPVQNLNALANPAALDGFRDRPELES